MWSLLYVTVVRVDTMNEARQHMNSRMQQFQQRLLKEVEWSLGLWVPESLGLWFGVHLRLRLPIVRVQPLTKQFVGA